MYDVRIYTIAGTFLGSVSTRERFLRQVESGNYPAYSLHGTVNDIPVSGEFSVAEIMELVNAVVT